MFMNSLQCHCTNCVPLFHIWGYTLCKQQRCWKLKTFDMSPFDIQTFCTHFLTSCVHQSWKQKNVPFQLSTKWICCNPSIWASCVQVHQFPQSHRVYISANSATHPWLTQNITSKQIETLVWRLMKGVARN